MSDDANQPAMAIGPEPEIPPVPEDASDELSLARELVLRAHPNAVHELIAGNTLAEMLDSVPAAEAAYARVAEATRAAASQSLSPELAMVPGGSAVRSATVNLDGLGPLAKIRAGLNRS